MLTGFENQPDASCTVQDNIFCFYTSSDIFYMVADYNFNKAGRKILSALFEVIFDRCPSI